MHGVVVPPKNHPTPDQSGVLLSMDIRQSDLLLFTNKLKTKIVIQTTDASHNTLYASECSVVKQLQLNHR